jgi:hypothetical protein
MDMKAIRKLRLADPFEPFELVLEDGRTLPVEKPFYLAIAPDDRMVVHSSINGGFERLRPESIRSVDFLAAENGDAA